MILLTPQGLHSVTPPRPPRCAACLQFVVWRLSRITDAEPLYKLCTDDTDNSISADTIMCRARSVECLRHLRCRLPRPLRVLELGPELLFTTAVDCSLTELLPAEQNSTCCLAFTLSKYSRYRKGREGRAIQEGLAKRAERQGLITRRDRQHLLGERRKERIAEDLC